MNYCVRCGIAIKKGAFCYHCGAIPKEEDVEQLEEIMNCYICGELCKIGRISCEACRNSSAFWKEKKKK